MPDVAATVMFVSETSKPLIGITGRQYRYAAVAGSPALLADSVVDAVLADYVNAVLASGGLPVHIPMDVDPAEIVDRLDGIVLTGGADVEPVRYDAATDPETGTPEVDRDGFELAVAGAAVAGRVPTLGVCRGLQILNVEAGGTLKQHVPVHARYDRPPEDLVHRLDIEEGSVLHRLYGDQHQTNSYHHQVIDRVGDGYTITARATDGEIEAIELPDAPVVGIQWHPEMLQRQDPVFDWLVATAQHH